MNEIEIFNNPEFGEVRTLVIDAQPWFVGRDVCAVFGDTNSSRSIGRIDDDDKRTIEITDNKGRKQNAIFVNESGLYALLFAMQPQKANHDGVSDAYPIEIQERIDKLHKFKRWVTSEVLPSIRKTGGYKIKNADPLKEKRLEIMERNATARQAKVMLEFAKLGLSSESKELLASNAVEIMTGKRLLPLPTTEKTYSAGEVGKMLGISANMVGRIANANNLKTDEYGITVLDSAKNGKQIPTFRYNDAGIERLKEIIG